MARQLPPARSMRRAPRRSRLRVARRLRSWVCPRVRLWARTRVRRRPWPRANPWLHPATLGALVLCAAIGFGLWAAANRPRAAPDAPGRVAGLAFAPFQRGQSPENGTYPTEAQIRADLERVAALTGRIRTYTVQGVLGRIPALAEGLGLRVTLGAWLSGKPGADAEELRHLVALARAAPEVDGGPVVDRVLVGNEAVLRGDLTPARLAAHLREVKRRVRVPVSTAEPWHVWLDHPELAQAADYITVHLLPYWEKLPVEDALRFVLEKYDAVAAAYPGKPVVIGEVGWPSAGVDVGAARASRVNQARFLRAFFAAAEARGLDYYVMEAFDQPWKTSFEGRAAGHWGMMDLDRRPKWPLAGPVQEVPDWLAWAVPSTAAAALLALLLLSRRPDLRPVGKLLLAGLAQALCATFVLVPLAMAGQYLSPAAAAVWAVLAAGQALLLLLLLADAFELVETLWGRTWRRRARFVPAPEGAPAPMVSVHLPVCNEPPAMVRETLRALARLDYPAFEVLVVANNTADPALWEPLAEECARLGPRFRFFHLGAWPGFKAGALNFARRETAPDAEIVAVLDSDYAVDRDWLRGTVPQFADPRVGFVQSPQDYRDGGASPFKRMMFWEYAGFFRLGMVTRNERDAIIQHGTMVLVRRSALDAVGGWAEWTITEDAELGLRLFRAGWQAVYSEQSFGRGVMPDSFAAYRKQRARWAYGAVQILRGHGAALFNPFDRTLTAGQRWHFVTGWLPWLGDALGLLFLLVGLVWSAGLILAPMRFEFPVVLFMLPSVGLFAFKLARGAALYAARVPCGRAERLGAAVAGLALSHGVARAVWKGLLVRRAPFLRTPKMRDVPPLSRGLAAAREELALLLLAWAALAGVGLAHRFATWEATLWCLVLFAQSLPYAASVAVSAVSALPASARRRAARHPAHAGAGD